MKPVGVRPQSANPYLKFGAKNLIKQRPISAGENISLCQGGHKALCDKHPSEKQAWTSTDESKHTHDNEEKIFLKTNTEVKQWWNNIQKESLAKMALFEKDDPIIKTLKEINKTLEKCPKMTNIMVRSGIMSTRIPLLPSNKGCLAKDLSPKAASLKQTHLISTKIPYIREK